MKDTNGAKLCEVRLDENGFRFRYANPNPMTADQKFCISAAALGVTAFLGFFMALFISVF